jgi:hypothetical protein
MPDTQAPAQEKARHVPHTRYIFPSHYSHIYRNPSYKKNWQEKKGMNFTDTTETKVTEATEATDAKEVKDAKDAKEAKEAKTKEVREAKVAKENTKAKEDRVEKEKEKEGSVDAKVFIGGGNLLTPGLQEPIKYLWLPNCRFSLLYKATRYAIRECFEIK